MDWKRHDWASAGAVLFCLAGFSLFVAALRVFGLLGSSPDELAPFAGLAFAMLVEHAVLIPYNKPSTISRIYNNRNTSLQCDLFYVFVYGTGIAAFLINITFPGLVLTALRNAGMQSAGLLSHIIPSNYVIYTGVYLLLRDLAQYVAHLAMHKVPFLWHFHKLHHAATDYNVLLNVRHSLGEDAIKRLF